MPDITGERPHWLLISYLAFIVATTHIIGGFCFMAGPDATFHDVVQYVDPSFTPNSSLEATVMTSSAWNYFVAPIPLFDIGLAAVLVKKYRRPTL